MKILRQWQFLQPFKLVVALGLLVIAYWYAISYLGWKLQSINTTAIVAVITLLALFKAFGLNALITVSLSPNDKTVAYLAQVDFFKQFKCLFITHFLLSFFAIVFLLMALFFDDLLASKVGIVLALLSIINLWDIMNACFLTLKHNISSRKKMKPRPLKSTFMRYNQWSANKHH